MRQAEGRCDYKKGESTGGQKRGKKDDMDM